MKMTDEKLEFLVQAEIQSLKYKYYVNLCIELKNEKKRLHNAYMEQLKQLEERKLDWKVLKNEPVSNEWYEQIKKEVATKWNVEGDSELNGDNAEQHNPVLLDPAIFGKA